MASGATGVPPDVELSLRLPSSEAERPLSSAGGALHAADGVRNGESSARVARDAALYEEMTHWLARWPVPAPTERQGCQLRLAGAAPPERSETRDLPREFPHRSISGAVAPTSVSCYDDRAWRELPRTVSQMLVEGFMAGLSVMELYAGPSLWLFDFVRMVMINVEKAEEKPIVWNQANVRPPPSQSAAEGSGRSDWNIRVGGVLGGQNRRLNWRQLQILDDGDTTYTLVEEMFLESLTRTAVAARITCIRKCLNNDAVCQARIRVFQTWESITKAVRGYSSVSYGWFGGPVEQIASVIVHGFGRPNHQFVSHEVQAVGVYLTPAMSPRASLSVSFPDATGEHHVLLCRVILGKTEVVDLRSPRFDPGVIDFDTGVDRADNPSWYIVWPTHMNTHILPEFVISFRTCQVPELRGFNPLWSRPPQTMIFETVFAELGSFLPVARVHAMGTLFNFFKAGKLTREAFVKNMAAIGGPKLLLFARVL